MSIYLKFRSAVISDDNAEGVAYPLLKVVLGDDGSPTFFWAMAVRKPDGVSGNVTEKHRNRLLVALLQTLGFKWDKDFADYALQGYHVFHLEAGGVLPSFGANTFDGGTLPDFITTLTAPAADTVTNEIIAPGHTLAAGDQLLFGEPAADGLPDGLSAGVVYIVASVAAGRFKLKDEDGDPVMLTSTGGACWFALETLLNPVGGTLKVASNSETGEKPGNDSASFGMQYFKYVGGSIKYHLAPAGNVETNPEFKLQFQLPGSVVEITKGESPNVQKWLQLGLDQLPGNVSLQLPENSNRLFAVEQKPFFGGGRGEVCVNRVVGQTMGSGLTVVKPDQVDLGESRYHRQTLTGWAISYLHVGSDVAPDEVQLVIELIAGVRFTPLPGLPLTVLVESDLLSATFRRNGNATDFAIHMRPGRICLRVSIIEGPMIEAASGSSNWLAHAQMGNAFVSAKMKAAASVEDVGDMLSYTVEFCLDKDFIWTPELLNKLETPLLKWAGPTPDLPDFEDFRKWLIALRDLDVRFPNVGRPPAFRGFEIQQMLSIEDPNLPNMSAPEFKIPVLKLEKVLNDFPDIIPPEIPGLFSPSLQPDFSRLKLRIRKKLVEFPDLDNLSNINGFEITFPAILSPGLVAPFPIEVWLGDVQLPGVKVVDIAYPRTIRLNVRLGDFTLPTYDKIKLFVPGLSYERRIRFIQPGTLEIQLEGPDWPLDGLGLFRPDIGDLVEIHADISFPDIVPSMSGLLGELPGVDIRLTVPDFAFQARPLKLSDLLVRVDGIEKIGLPVPMELLVRMPRPDVELPLAPKFKLWLGVTIDLSTLRLLDNRIYFYFPEIEQGLDEASGKSVELQSVRHQAVDFGFLTLSYPMRVKILRPPQKEDHDGFLDVAKKVFQITLKYKQGEESEPAPKISAFLPGGMDERAVRLGLEQIEALPDEGTKSDLRREYSKRFRLALDKVDEKWPEPPVDPLYFRLDAKGVTFNATLVKTEVEIDTSGHAKGEEEDSSGVIEPFKLNPQEAQGSVQSRVVIIGNKLKEATVCATTFVPGVKNLLAMVQVSLKQGIPGKPPEVTASMQLERPDEAPIAGCSVGMFEMELKKLKLGLTWFPESNDWDYLAEADGSLGFTADADLIPDLEGLRGKSIEFIGLDLRRMNLRQVRLPINLTRPARFEILSGQFAVELGDLTLGWEFSGRVPRLQLLECKLASFEYLDPGALQVKIRTGGLHIDFDANLKARIRMPSRLGVEVSLGASIKCSGDIGWVDEAIERFLFASIKVVLDGMPEVTALMKFGTGLKLNKAREINMALYGTMEYEKPLYPGLVVKELGMGIGLNNRLKAIPSLPSASVLIENVDTLDPGDIDSWAFVEEDGFYLSIVGSAFFAEKPGSLSEINAYVLSLILSFDTNFDLIAAGKVWLACSMNKVKENLAFPALTGAMVLSPQQQKLELAVESLPSAYVEANDFLKMLLQNLRIRFTFRLTPDLLDYYLEEVSYTNQMFGFDLKYLGSYRFAIYKRAVLVRSDLAVTGKLHKNMPIGRGAFDFDGEIRIAVGYGGLLTERGARAYAYIDASARFYVSAWIKIGFSKSFKICRKRITISWSVTFSTSAPSLELSIRGRIGFDDNEPGLVGADCMVGISLSICGYALKGSGQFSHRGEIYDHVRQEIAAFEQQLEDAIQNKKAKEEQKQIALQTAAPVIMGANGQPNGAAQLFDFELAALAEPERISRQISQATAAAPSEKETWLHYSRSGDDLDYQLLLPDSRSPWLAPKHGVVQSIELTNSGNKAVVTCENHGLRAGDAAKAGLIGLRSNPLAKSKMPPAISEFLSQVYTVEAVDTRTFTLNIGTSGLTDAIYDNLEGAWYIARDAGTGGINQETPHLVQDVERIVVIRGEWLDITKGASVSANGVTEVTLTVASLKDVKAGSRVLIRDSRDAGQDFSTAVQPCVTVEVSAVDEQALTVTVRIYDSTPSKIPRDWNGWGLATAKEVATFWNARNRVAGLLAGHFDLETYNEFGDGAATMLESSSAAPETVELPPDYRAFRMVSDPRYASRDRHWMRLEDQFLLPPEVLSTQFRPVADVVDASNAELRQINRYMEARDKLRLHDLHEGHDFDPGEALLQTRAAIAHSIIEDLSAPGGPAAYGERGGNGDLVYGLAFQLELDDKETLPAVFIRRTGSSLTAINVRTPDIENTNPVANIYCHPVRQDFVVDASAEQGSKEKGRVVVKLPLGYANGLLEKNLERVGRLQIYRQFSWEKEPVLLQDYVRPDISFLPRPETVLENLSGIVRQQSIINVGIDLTGESLKGLLVSVKSIEDRLFRIKQVVLPASIILHDDIPGLNGKSIQFKIMSAGSIVPGPYVFTDEFHVIDRQLADPEFVKQRLSVDVFKVEYSLRVVPQGEQSATVDLQKERNEGRMAAWETINLHIPEPTPFPKQLAAEVSFKDLIRDGNDDESEMSFRLLSLEGESPGLAMFGERYLQHDDFELWAAEEPLIQSGWYTGENGAADEGAAPVDNSRISIQSIQTEPDLVSTDKKFRLPVSVEYEGSSTFIVKNCDSLFLTGMGYKLFIKPARLSEISLLAPVSILVVRETPVEWNGSVRYRSAAQIERIPKTAVGDFKNRRPELLSRDLFSADDLFRDGGNAIRTVWESLSLLDGGNEIIIRDLDDSRFVHHQLCEVLEADEFRRRQTTFSSSSTWELTRLQRREQLAGKPGIARPLVTDDLREFFLTDTKLKDHRLFRGMESSFNELETELTAGASWKAIAEAAVDFLISQNLFLKSPLNLAALQVRQFTTAMGRVIRALLLGLKFPALPLVGDGAWENPESSDPNPQWQIAGSGNWVVVTGATVASDAPLILHTDTTELNDGDLIELRDIRGIRNANTTVGEFREVRILSSDQMAIYQYEPVEDGIAAAALSAELTSLEIATRAQLKKIDELPLPYAAIEEEVAGFLDRGTAQELEGYMRRRFSVADDTMSLRSANDSGSATIDSRVALVRKKEWEDTLVSARGFLGVENIPPDVLPQTAALLALTQNGLSSAAIATLSSIFKAFHAYLTDDAAETRYAKLLSRAAGLSRALTTLEEKQLLPRQWALVKRPHHELTTEEDAVDGRKAQETFLSAYLPDSAAVSEPKGLPATPTPEIIELPLRAARLVRINQSGVVDVWSGRGGSPGGGSNPREFTRLRRMHQIDTGDKTNAPRQVRLLYHEDRHLMLTLCEGKRARLWDLLSGKPLREFFESTGKFSTNAVVFASTRIGLRCITADTHDGEHKVRLWDPTQAKPTGVFSRKLPDEIEIATGRAAPFRCVSFEEQSGLVAAGTASIEVASGFSGDGAGYKIDGDHAQGESTIRLKDGAGTILVDGIVMFGDGNKYTVQSHNSGASEITLTRGLAGDIADNATVTLSGSEYLPGAVVLWRNMGKAKQDNLPVRSGGVLRTCIRLNAVESGSTTHKHVNHLQFIRVPEGVLLVAASNEKLFLIDVDSRRVQRELTLTAGAEITSLAFDNVRLQLAVGCANGVVQYWNWHDLSQRHEFTPAGAKKIYIDFLRSGGESWLVTSFEEDKDTRLHKLTADGKWDANHVQTLPGGGQSQGVATALMPAVTSSTGQSVVSLWHLWERMGFALDFAMVDERNRILPLRELRQQVARLKTEKGHFLTMLNPLEPDSDYREDDQVGFSFINLAVVPEEFHNLCLTTGPKWFGEAQLGDYSGENLVPDVALLRTGAIIPAGITGACKVAVLSGPGAGNLVEVSAAPDEISDLDCKLFLKAGSFTADDLKKDTPSMLAVFLESDYDALAHWLKFRSVYKPVDWPNRIIELLHVRELARYVGEYAPEKLLGDLGNEGASKDRVAGMANPAVEPKAERWLTVPASGNWSHSVWTLPGRKGHRLETTVRRVSRYEPLIRWALLDYNPFDVPIQSVIDQGVVAAGSNGNKISLPQGNQMGQQHTGRFPLHVEITKGDGAGQRRAMLDYAPADIEAGTHGELVFDPGDGFIGDITAAGGDAPSHYRVLAHGQDWSMLELPPTLHLEKGEGNKALTVYQYPHERLIQFSYQLPLEGARSLYNQISRIRTGWQGVEQAFRYEIRDRGPNHERRLSELLSAVVFYKQDSLPAPASRLAALGGNQESRIRLLRHERLVTLPDLPFYYQYRLDVRSLFESQPRERDELTAADVLPSSENLSPKANRPPTQLLIFQPDIAVNTSDNSLQTGDCSNLPEDKPVLKFVALQVLAGYTPDNEGSDPSVYAEFTRTKGGAKVTRTLLVSTWSLPDEKSTVATVQVREPFAAGMAPGAGWTYVLRREEFNVTLPVVRQDDHLTQLERETEPAPLFLDNIEARLPASHRAAQPISLAAGRLPDFAFSYKMSWKLRIGGNSPGETELFSKAALLALPWSTDFHPIEFDPVNQPILTVPDGVKILTQSITIRLPDSLTELTDILKKATGLDIEENGLSLQEAATSFTAFKLQGDGRWSDGSTTTQFTGRQDFENTSVKFAANSQPTDLRLEFATPLEVSRLSIPLELIRLHEPATASNDHHSVAWQVNFRLRILQSAGKFDDPARYFLQGKREGEPTSPVQFSRTQP